MLMDLLNKAVTVAMLSFVVSSMLAMGSGLTIRQIIEPLRDARLVLLALLANFVLMPLGALALAKVLWLDDPFAVGLLVLGCAAGAPRSHTAWTHKRHLVPHGSVQVKLVASVGSPLPL
jgi:predicted Na+-dependent transporter